MELNTVIGAVAGILTSASSIPQIVKVYKDQEASAVSPIMFFVLLLGNGLWAFYGLRIDDHPILFTNSFAVVADAVMIFLNYRYSKS